MIERCIFAGDCMGFFMGFQSCPLRALAHDLWLLEGKIGWDLVDFGWCRFPFIYLLDLLVVEGEPSLNQRATGNCGPGLKAMDDFGEILATFGEHVQEI